MSRDVPCSRSDRYDGVDDARILCQYNDLVSGSVANAAFDCVCVRVRVFTPCAGGLDHSPIDQY